VIAAIRCVAVVAMVTAAAGAAQAQTPAYIVAKPGAVSKAFGHETMARIFSDSWTPVRQAAVLRSQQTVPGFDCPADPQIALVDVIPYPVEPGAVSWIERFVLGCQPRTMRSFLMILDGGAPRAIELLPGQSNADPLLQRNALQGSMAAAGMAASKDCKRILVIDTRVTAQPAAGGLWSERWTYDVCGARAEIEMTFTPSDKGGTNWHARLVK
jgi:hypothetical protein